ncbi:MAG: hypothetical protein JRE20_02415 [Deltaproteobacteria bacterium]|nr:hypothetical protein [Deltaproteobacteria bacterium]
MLCPDVSGLWGISICNKHLGLWLARLARANARVGQGAQPGEVKSRPPPKAHSPPGDRHKDYYDSQIPPWDDECCDSDYPF